MALLEINQSKISDPDKISALMAEQGLSYEYWGTRATPIADDGEVLAAYGREIAQLKRERGYVQTDLVALRPDTPNLDAICQKFVKEHHHREDEVRFTVEGEGVFEIRSRDGKYMLKITTYPGDLIVIPAHRRHLFYLTEKQQIRCIRLFHDLKGWEAIYAPAEQAG